MNLKDTKVVRVGFISYVTLPGGVPVSVTDNGKIDVVREVPAVDPLEPYPYTGGNVPSALAENAIDNAVKVAQAVYEKSMQQNEKSA